MNESSRALEPNSIFQQIPNCKLVRDNMPEIVNPSDRGLFFEPTKEEVRNNQALVQRLYQAKVQEEVLEFLSAGTLSDLIEEAADVLEAMVGYIDKSYPNRMAESHERDFTIQEILTTMGNKFQHRGGFKNTVIMNKDTK